MNEKMVLIYDAPDQVTAEVVCAGLEAAGIAAVVSNTTAGPASGLLPHLGLAWNRGVAVPASQAETARTLLQSQLPSDAELIAEEEADTLTLEEAEARVRDL